MQIPTSTSQLLSSAQQASQQVRKLRMNDPEVPIVAGFLVFLQFMVFNFLVGF